MKVTLPAMIFSLFKLSNQLEHSSSDQIPIEQPSEDDAMQLIKVDQLKIFKNVNELILAL